jgi:hypothetical protein
MKKSERMRTMDYAKVGLLAVVSRDDVMLWMMMMWSRVHVRVVFGQAVT